MSSDEKTLAQSEAPGSNQEAARSEDSAAPLLTPGNLLQASARTEGGTEIQLPSHQVESRLRSKGPLRAAGYKILELLGMGTCGEVWLAQEERTGIRVAIKFFAHGAGLDWQLLQAEVQQLCQLHADPGIIKLIDVEIASTPPYYVMAYAEGGSLAKKLEKGPIPFADAMRIFRQVAEALAYVHAKGIRHCDLKPGNVLIDARGRVRVADFGQAHLSSDASPALGTFFYMAPEQATLTPQIPDTRWDVYALGALMYAMLTGRPPREDSTLRSELAGTVELSHRLQRYRDAVHRAPRPTSHRKVCGIDRAMVDIIDGCLAIKPEERLRDAGAVLTALDRRKRRRRQRPALVFGLIAPILLFLVTAGLVWLVFSVAKENATLGMKKMQKNIMERDKFIAELVADEIQENLEKCIKRVERTAKQPALRQALQKRDAAKLANLLKPQDLPFIGTSTIGLLASPLGQGSYNATSALFPGRADHKPDPIKFIWCAAGTGEILAIAPPVELPKINYQWRDWFSGKGDQQEHTRADPIRKTYISHPFVSKVLNQPLVIAIATPVQDPDDEEQIVGVLAASIHVKIFEKWTSRLDLDNHIAVILNERGEYLSHAAKDAIKPDKNGKVRSVPIESVLHTQVLHDKEAGIVNTPFTDPINGKTYTASYAPLKRREVPWDTGWVVLIQQEHTLTSPAIEQLNRSMFTISLIAAVVMAVLIPGLWVWLIWMLRREERVAHA